MKSRRFRLKPKKRAGPALWAVAFFAAVCVAGGGTWMLSSRSVAAGASSVTFQTVPSSALASEGMSFGAPSRPALLTHAQAEQAALAAYPGPLAAVRETHLVDVHNKNLPLLDGRTLWAVSVTPGNGFERSAGPVENGSPSSATFQLVFVDPQDGSFVMGDSGN